MKETGIVRRVDELGRIVIPKEIRKTLDIKQGEPLEIYVEKDLLVFKKYSPLKSDYFITQVISQSLSSVTDMSVYITDREKVLVATRDAKIFEGEKLTKKAYEIIQNKQSFSISESENLYPLKLCEVDEGEFKSQIILPILKGDEEAYGLVVLADKRADIRLDAEKIKLTGLSAKILSLSIS